MSGLKELWGLSDPAALAPAVQQRVEPVRAALQKPLSVINAALRYTAAAAPPRLHAPLAARRDAMVQSYQLWIESDATDQAPLKQALLDARGLTVDAQRLADDTRVAKERWESLAADQSAAADEQPDGVRIDAAVQAANQREYDAACRLLESIAGDRATGRGARRPAPGDGARPPRTAERRFKLLGPVAGAPPTPSDPRDLAAWQNPFVASDPRELFSPERMDEVVGMEFRGESAPGNDDLNQAMKAILFADPGADLSAHLAKIGELRGLEPDVVAAQFERFQQIQGVGLELESTRGLPPDEAMTSRRREYQQTHGEFLGTRSSLRFGQVVGESLGLDPAFAAMLNPTGGMVGPGMDILTPTDADSPLVWHGIFHDAGGYLRNYQNAGPGYTYNDHDRGAADPVQGQLDGVSYWYDRWQPERSVLEDLYSLNRDQSAYEAYVSGPIHDAERFATGASQEAVANVANVAAEGRRISKSASAGLKDSGRTVAGAVNRTVGEADRAVGSLADTARGLGMEQADVSAAEQRVLEQLAGVSQRVAAWESEFGAEVDAAGAATEQSIDELERWAAEAGAAVDLKGSALSATTERAAHQALVDLGRSEAIRGVGVRGVNLYAESMQEVERVRADVSERLDRAEHEVIALCSPLLDTSRDARDAASARLAAARADAVAKLERVREVAMRGLVAVEGRLDSTISLIERVSQDAEDAAGGVEDGMTDAVDSGSDALANTITLASDFASGRLASLANLLG